MATIFFNNSVRNSNRKKRFNTWFIYLIICHYSTSNILMRVLHVQFKFIIVVMRWKTKNQHRFLLVKIRAGIKMSWIFEFVLALLHIYYSRKSITKLLAMTIRNLFSHRKSLWILFCCCCVFVFFVSPSLYLCHIIHYTLLSI